MKYFDNLYFLEKEISEEKFKVMEEKIQKTLDECNKYNYSPIEKVLFFYDKVKQFRYKDNGNPDVVRKLDDVIINEKGVCAGFVNAFNEYLLRTGFKCTPIFLTYDDNRKHTCEIADIDDDKYDIHGIYIFDPTFDSIDSSDMDRNLYYTFFAKELSEYDTAKEIFKFEPATSFFFKYSDLDINSINEINPAFFF